MELGSARARPIAMPATVASSTGKASGPTEEQETADCRAGSVREEEEETFAANFGAEATCAVAICVMLVLAGATCGQGTVSLGMPQTPGVVLPTGQERRIPGIQRQRRLPCAT